MIFDRVVKKGFTEVVTFEQRFEGEGMSPTINGGRAAKLEWRASAEALSWSLPWEFKEGLQ